MVHRQIDKIAVAYFLEATKSVLKHLADWNMDLSSRGLEGPKGLTQIYGSVRRLRDYLQRCLAAYPHPVDLDLSDDDENLLAACCLFETAMLDTRAEVEKLSPQEQNWMDEKRRHLADWCVTLATHPIETIPSPDRMALTTPTVQAVTLRLNQKLHQREAPVEGRPAPGGIVKGYFLPEDLAPTPTTRSIKAKGLHFGPPPQSSNKPPTPTDAEGVAATPLPPPVAAHANLVDPRKIRDPRLRAMLAMDLRAFDRALEAQDYRLALVHLSSLLEGAVLDHALSRRRELELQGSPDTWNIEQILSKVLGPQFTSLDRGSIFHLLAARNLIRPATQLQLPIVVTGTTLEQLTTFVQRILVELGLNGSARAQPSPVDHGGLPATEGELQARAESGQHGGGHDAASGRHDAGSGSGRYGRASGSGRFPAV